MKRIIRGDVHKWLKGNMRARPAYVYGFLYALFTGAGLLARAIGQAYGWWPESGIGVVAVYFAISGVLGALLVILSRAQRRRSVCHGRAAMVLAASAQSNNGMHPTANSAALIRKTWP